MELSILIVNYRAWDDLELCLESLAPLKDSAAPTCEVIVVDNASGDGRLAGCESRFPWVQFIASEYNYGFAHGCNLGASAATGRELLFLNPDCRDPGGQVERLYAIKISTPQFAVLAPRQLDEQGRAQKAGDHFPGPWTLIGPVRALLRALSPARFADARSFTEGLHPIDWVSGSALIMSAQTLERLGGWCDAYWMYSEDVDLCRRAADLGLLAAVTADASLIHRHGGASRATPELTVLTKSEAVISKHLYAGRHLPATRRWLFHLLVIGSRYLPRALAALTAPFLGQHRLRVEAGVFLLLSRYYLGVLRCGHWISPRSIRQIKASSSDQEN